MQALLERPVILSPDQAAARKTGPRPFRGQGELWDLKDRYLAWMMATRYAETTIKGAHSDLLWLFKYLAQREIDRMADVTPDVLKDYSLWLRENKSHKREGQALALSHIHHRLMGVKNFFRWLTKETVILCDPSEDLEIPRLHNGLPQTIITQEEAKRLLDTPDLKSPVGYRDKALLELLYASGIRSRELLRVKVDHVDLRNRILVVKNGKGCKDRIIPLPLLTSSYLQEYITKVRPKFAGRIKGQDDGTLFLNFTGARVDMSRLCYLMQTYTKKAGLTKRVTPMTLRHSIASHLLENGMDVRYIQEFLGHEKLSTTQIYAKVTLSGLRKMYNRHHPKEKRQRHEKI